MSASAEKKILDLARKSGGVIRPRDLQRKGLPQDYLWRLHQKEKLERVGRGMYAIPGAFLSEHQTIVQAALRLPHGVVCLLSALRFHELTTQAPFEVWMAIDGKARAPKEDRIKSMELRSKSTIPPKQSQIVSSTGTRSGLTSRSKHFVIVGARRARPPISFGIMQKYAVWLM